MTKYTQTHRMEPHKVSWKRQGMFSLAFRFWGR